MRDPFARLEMLERRYLTGAPVEQRTIAETIRAEIDPEWTPDHLEPTRVQPRRRPGELKTEALSLLRRQSEALSSRALARLLADEIGADASDDKVIRNLDHCVHQALKGSRDPRIQRMDGAPARWLWAEARAA